MVDDSIQPWAIDRMGDDGPVYHQLDTEAREDILHRNADLVECFQYVQRYNFGLTVSFDYKNRYLSLKADTVLAFSQTRGENELHLLIYWTKFRLGCHCGCVTPISRLGLIGFCELIRVFELVVASLIFTAIVSAHFLLDQGV